MDGALKHNMLLPAAGIVGDLLAVALGWFLFLTEFWFIPPLVGGLAALVSGAALQIRHERRRPG